MRQELAARDYSPSVRFRKRWNPVWISHFLNRTDGKKIRCPAELFRVSLSMIRSCRNRKRWYSKVPHHNHPFIGGNLVIMMYAFQDLARERRRETVRWGE